MPNVTASAQKDTCENKDIKIHLKKQKYQGIKEAKL